MHSKDQKKFRVPIAITIALWLIGLVIPILSNSLIKRIEPWFAYEYVFTIMWVFIFLLGLSIFYYRNLIDIINNQQLDRNLPTNKEPVVTDEDTEKDFHKVLSELTGDEKNILKQYIEKDIRYLPFGWHNGTVRSLMERNILFLPSGPWLGWRDPSFSIDPTVMKILKQNQNFLK
ncbi:MAG: super-infection exclusion protein B [archaeon]